MDRFFGRAKQEPKKQNETIPTKKTEYNMGKRTAEIDSKCDALENKLKTLETDIKCYYEKLKRTNLKSEKNYLKGRVKNLLMRRKQIEHQLSNYNGQRMRMDQVQFAQQNIQDTLEMAHHMKEMNQVHKEQLEDMDFDQVQDTFEEMEELMHETKYLNDLVAQNYDVDLDEDLDAELENLETELEVQDMMKRQNEMNPQQGYDPLKN